MVFIEVFNLACDFTQCGSTLLFIKLMNEKTYIDQEVQQTSTLKWWTQT